MASRLLLNAIVADGGCRREPGLNVARLEQLPLPHEVDDQEDGRHDQQEVNQALSTLTLVGATRRAR